MSHLFLGLEAALLARDDFGLAPRLVDDAAAAAAAAASRCARAEATVGVERLDVAAQSALGARRVVAERTAVVEVQAHVRVELQLRIACSRVNAIS